MARRPARSRNRTRVPARTSRFGGWLLWLAVLAAGVGVVWIWWRGGSHDVVRRNGSAAAGADSRTQARGAAARPLVPTLDEILVRPVSTTSVDATREKLAGPTNAPPVSPPDAMATTNEMAPSPPRTASAISVEPQAWQGRDRVVAVQLALSRHGISSGPIDGVMGSQTRAALRAFQELEGLPVTGALDGRTLGRLQPTPEEVYGWHLITAEDLARLTPVPSTWLGKSFRERLDFESILELVSEKSHAHPRLVRALNPGLDWYQVKPGTAVRVPRLSLPASAPRAAQVRIHLGGKSLTALDARDRLLMHFPCSIARRVEKRPVGVLRVVKVAPNPNYRFDPDIFPESAEGQQLGRRLMIPPGPNNPVGTVWIGLDRPGYGIHGTPHPEDVGRTESHGCFRLANWNAELLLNSVWVGMPVHVEP